MTLVTSIRLQLPDWIAGAVQADRIFPDADSKMALAIELSQINIASESGGPFGAAVFDEAGHLVGVGVNRVIPMQCSAAHAEVMALASSQQSVGRNRLNESGARYTLASSSQPCAMCYGALIWAGIDELLIGARSDDVQELAGFDEGPLPDDWQGELERRGIRVQRDLQRERACAVLREYGKGGHVY